VATQAPRPSARNKSAPRKRMSASERREEILAAATEVFAENGFHQTAIDKVAQQAGVSKALIYEHFASKSELQETVLRQITTDLFELIATRVAAEPNDSIVRLRTGIDAYFQFIEERRAAWHMMFRESVGREASEVLLALEPTFVSGIAAVLSESPEAAPLLDKPEGLLQLRVGAQMLTGAMHWLGNWWVDNIETVPRETMVQWALDAMWLGVEGWAAKTAAAAAAAKPA
jgi:AcrR family transcriptional regulator